MWDSVKYLDEHLVQQSFLKDLVLQIQKDFQTTVDTDIVFSVETPSELVSQVIGQLHRIIHSTNVSRFSSLLYRIDVSERDIKAIKNVDIDEYIERVAYLIIKREFQKVYIRKSFQE
ncbi:hypothetical protein [Myroides sp. LoEW2-1]|uniref:hypothetical protein n=1 Tax=Myroides sp. LoEW2-1 TaxID=2683192 RepID=UPI00132B9080|nr:hypothetical protein [Myroides sp. LoEW2-1]MVX35585.1 hypothetical protein [Myroides sp. LoEW2-1]